MSALAREINATFSGQPLGSARSFDISLLNSARRSPPLPPLHPLIPRFSLCLPHYPGEHFGRYRREIYLDPSPSCFILAKKGCTNIETFGKYRDESSFNRRKMFCFRLRYARAISFCCTRCIERVCTRCFLISKMASSWWNRACSIWT